MFLMLAGITLALLAIGFRFTQLIMTRAAAAHVVGNSDWKNPIEAALQEVASEDEHPLLEQEDKRRE